MPHHVISHRDLERRLLALPVGAVARLHGAVVHRMSDWTWCVGGGAEGLLLVTVDEVARASRFIPDGTGEGEKSQRGAFRFTPLASRKVQ